VCDCSPCERNGAIQPVFMTVPVLCRIISECEDDIATKTHSALSLIPEK
jgi:hypothetical protein